VWYDLCSIFRGWKDRSSKHNCNLGCIANGCFAMVNMHVLLFWATSPKYKCVGRIDGQYLTEKEASYSHGMFLSTY